MIAVDITKESLSVNESDGSPTVEVMVKLSEKPKESEKTLSAVTRVAKESLIVNESEIGLAKLTAGESESETASVGDLIISNKVTALSENDTLSEKLLL
jgi:hypothetical protein